MIYKYHKWEHAGKLEKEGYFYKRIRVWCRHCGALAEATDFYSIRKDTIKLPVCGARCGKQ